MKAMDQVDEAWWLAFFDDAYADLYLATDTAESRARRDATADFIVDALALQPGDRVLDQGCGVGRMACALARRGLSVVGVDVIDGYIERARAAARSEGVDGRCSFQVGDARDFVPNEACDAVINWYTSFGYSADDDENARMLRAAHDSLKPGGRFLLDHTSLPFVLSNFRQSIVQRRTLPDGEELFVVQEPGLHFAPRMFRTRWTFVHPDGRKEVRWSENRAYMPEELMGLLERAGFASLELFGSIDRSPFVRESPRCILTARRPES
jgi:SAM-dependent methyltransferase